MNIVLVMPDECDVDRQVTLTDRRFVHIREVLRLKLGDGLRVGVLGGGRFYAEVVDLGVVDCRLKLGEAIDPLPEPNIDLLLALPRPKCLRRLWPQIVAMGVGRIYLVNAEKVERNYWGSHLLDPAEYLPLVVEGLEQAGDTRIPAITVSRRLKPLVEDELGSAYSEGCKLVAHPHRCCGDAARPDFSGASRILVAVGPEGGWSDYELGMFDVTGFRRFGIGGRTLRTDTACLALMAIVSRELLGSREKL